MSGALAEWRRSKDPWGYSKQGVKVIHLGRSKTWGSQILCLMCQTWVLNGLWPCLALALPRNVALYTSKWLRWAVGLYLYNDLPCLGRHTYSI